MTPDWIAIDWGTTNLRAWAMDARGGVLAEATSDQGMLNVADGTFEAALLALVSDWLPLDRTTLLLASGMVGARQGWIEAPYATVPSHEIDPATLTIAPASDRRIDLRILPGLCQMNPPDVMRGEETQVFGFLSAHPDFEGIICLPGTHSKWVQTTQSRIQGFQTAMTGELFALLSEHSVLKHSMSEGWDTAAFMDGVGASLAEPGRLTTSLFAIRAASLLRDVNLGEGNARLSGMLIGTELAAAELTGAPVALIGSGRMMDLYRDALAVLNIETITYDAGLATRTGLTSAYQAIAGASK